VSGRPAVPCANDAVGTTWSAECWGAGRCVAVLNEQKVGVNAMTWDSPLKKEAVDNDTNNE